MHYLNPSLDKKISALTKLKAFAENKWNTGITQNIEFVFNKVENIVGKGENFIAEHFLRIMFSKALVLKNTTTFFQVVPTNKTVTQELKLLFAS